MHIYVINLTRATARREKMEQQARALGLTLDFIEAVDGRTITDADRALVDHDRRRRVTAYPLTDNEIGCCLSHRRAMQRLIDSGDAMAVIVEDDVVLLPDFFRVLAAVEANGMPFDIVDLHRDRGKGAMFVPCRELLPGFRMGRAGYMHTNAMAYVMSREGAKKFLAYAPRITHAHDKEMHRSWANGLDIYGLEASVAVPGEGVGYSFIGETRGEGAGEGRPRYPDADRLDWRFRRWSTRVLDSLQKRLVFPAYVLKGRHPR